MVSVDVKHHVYLLTYLLTAATVGPLSWSYVTTRSTYTRSEPVPSFHRSFSVTHFDAVKHTQAKRALHSCVRMPPSQTPFDVVMHTQAKRALHSCVMMPPSHPELRCTQTAVVDSDVAECSHRPRVCIRWSRHHLSTHGEKKSSLNTKE